MGKCKDCINFEGFDETLEDFTCFATNSPVNPNDDRTCFIGKIKEED